MCMELPRASRPPFASTIQAVQNAIDASRQNERRIPLHASIDAPLFADIAKREVKTLSEKQKAERAYARKRKKLRKAWPGDDASFDAHHPRYEIEGREPTAEEREAAARKFAEYRFGR